MQDSYTRDQVRVLLTALYEMGYINGRLLGVNVEHADGELIREAVDAALADLRKRYPVLNGVALS